MKKDVIIFLQFINNDTVLMCVCGECILDLRKLSSDEINRQQFIQKLETFPVKSLSKFSPHL